MNRLLSSLTITTSKVAAAIFLAIALISLIGQLSIALMVDVSLEDVSTINQVGMQRALSQRAGILALAYQESRAPETAAQLVELASSFRQNNRTLLGDEKDVGRKPLRPSAVAYLASIQKPLQNYITDVVESTSHNSLTAPIAQQSADILKLLDQLVELEEQAARQHMENTLRNQWWFAGLSSIITFSLGFVLLRQFVSRDTRESEHLRETAEARSLANRHAKQYEESFRLSPVPLFSADDDGKILRANPAFMKLASVDSLASLEELDIYNLIREAAQRLCNPDSDGTIANKQTILDAEGIAHDVIISMHIQRGDESQRTQIEGAISDITELEKVKRQVQNSRARFRSLYDETPVMLCSLDADLCIIDTNQFMSKFLDTSFDQLRGTPITTLLPDNDEHTISAALQQAITQRDMVTVEAKLLTADDDFVPMRVFVRTLFGEDGALQNVFLTLLDLSDLAHAEEARDEIAKKLRTAEKLKAVGQLAAGIAHEINTPCQYVTDNLSFLAQAFGEITPRLQRNHGDEKDDSDFDLAFYEQELPDAITQSIDGMTQITKIVRAMKDFSHPGDDIKDPIDLNRLVESVTTVARNEWKYIAELNMNLAPDVGHVPCSSSAINQVILNIVVNAAHAMSDKFTDNEMGLISISTRRHSHHVEIAIEDNGCGIPEEHLIEIYNPFFTTKEVGKGTGQGLAIAHRIIVDEHGGSLNVSSTAGEGTRFEICLPHTPVENVA